MKTQTAHSVTEKKEKPFKLVKVFALTSLVMIFVGTVIITALNIRWARHIQLEKNREYAQVLVANLSHQVFQQFILPTVLTFGRTQLRDKQQFDRMDKVVRSTLHGFDVKTVNIYGPTWAEPDMNKRQKAASIPNWSAREIFGKYYWAFPKRGNIIGHPQRESSGDLCRLEIQHPFIGPSRHQ